MSVNPTLSRRIPLTLVIGLGGLIFLMVVLVFIGLIHLDGMNKIQNSVDRTN